MDLLLVHTKMIVAWSKEDAAIVASFANWRKLVVVCKEKSMRRF